VLPPSIQALTTSIRTNKTPYRELLRADPRGRFV